MKRTLVAGCLILIVVFSAAAQSGEIWLPLVMHNPCGEPAMSDWKVIVPEATTNKVLNPSGEIAGNFAAVGGGTLTRVTTYQRYELYAYRLQTAANDQGGSWTLAALANAIHYVTLRVRGTLPAAWDWSLNNSTYTAPTLLETLDGNWALYGLQFPAAQANGSTMLYIRQNGAGSGDFYIDGLQVEQKSYRTTYCDGEQDGCAWSGAAHASTSSRSAVSRAGGRERDLEDDYGLHIDGMAGLGAPPHTVTFDEYALLPGGELNAIKVHPRPFTLSGSLYGSTYSDIDSLRQALIGVLTPEAYPKDDLGWQPVRFIFTGGTTKRQIAAHYEAGLEGNVGREHWIERVALRLIAAENPFWEEAEGAEVAAVLDTNDSDTFRFLAGRLKNTGQWDALGAPTAAYPAATNIDSFVEDDTYLYLGGQFADLDGNGSADSVARYNKATGVYSALGTGTSVNVDKLLLKSNGNLIAIGGFTTIGGVAANRVAEWNGSTWSALGAGVDNVAYTGAIGLDGTLYVGGAFANAGGNPAAYIAAWDGSTWSALGSGLNNVVQGMAVGLDGTLYVCGQFTTAGGSPANYIAAWDGSTWSALGSGAGDHVYALAMTRDGTLYAGGKFTTIGGVSANRIAKWNGSAWSPLGTGVNNNVFHIAVGQDGMVYACGLFTAAGGITLTDRIAKWNGSTWAHLDIDLPGSNTVRVIFASEYVDPTVKRKYDLFVGWSIAEGTGYFAGKTTLTNAGIVEVHPRIVIKRSGGTAAAIWSIRNETTGKELLFDYALLDGETLTIDLDPMEQSIISSLFGPRADAVLANSDLGDFSLQPGDNDVTCFVNTVGSPTITAYMAWQNQYR